MLGALVTVIQAIPSIISLVSRLAAWLREEQTKKWLADAEEAVTKLEGAKTSEDRINAARSVVRLIRSL